jgi:hypothetical protein
MARFCMKKSPATMLGYTPDRRICDALRQHWKANFDPDVFYLTQKR